MTLMLLTTLFLLTTPLFCSISLKKRVECFLLPALAADVLIMYFFALFDCLPIGFWTVAAIKVIIMILIIISLIRNPKNWLVRLKEFFVTPGLLFFLIGIFLAFWLPEGKFFTGSDEFGWWGKCIRATIESDSIPLISKKTPSTYLNYPPAHQVASYLFFRFWNTDFSEYLCLVCYNIIAISALSTFFKQTSWRNWLLNFTLGCGLILAPYYFRHDFYQSVYVDSILGVIFASAVFLTIKNKNDFVDSIALLLVCSFLILIKRSATTLVIFVMLLPVVCVIKDLITDLKSHKKIRFETLKSAHRLLPLLAFLVNWSWALAFSHYCQQRGKFEVSGITAKKIFDTIYYNTPWMTERVINNFLSAFFTRNDYDIASLKISTFALGFSIFLITLFHVSAVREQKQRCRLSAITYLMFVYFLIYSFSLMILYIFIFTPYERVHLASFNRYESTFLLALTLFMIGALLYSENKKRIAAQYCLFLFLLPSVWLHYKHKPFVILDRINSEIFGHFVQNSYPGKKVLVLNQGGIGMDGAIMRYQYAAETFDVISIGNSGGNLVWRKKLTKKQLLQLLKKVDFCYLMRTDTVLVEQYGDLFQDRAAIAPKRLFVLKNDKLVQVPFRQFVLDFKFFSFLQAPKTIQGTAFFDIKAHAQKVRMLPNAKIVLLVKYIKINQNLSKITLYYAMEGNPSLTLICNKKTVGSATPLQLRNGNGTIEFELPDGVTLHDLNIQLTSPPDERAEFTIKRIAGDFSPELL